MKGADLSDIWRAKKIFFKILNRGGLGYLKLLFQCLNFIARFNFLRVNLIFLARKNAACLKIVKLNCSLIYISSTRLILFIHWYFSKPSGLSRGCLFATGHCLLSYQLHDILSQIWIFLSPCWKGRVTLCEIPVGTGQVRRIPIGMGLLPNLKKMYSLHGLNKGIWYDSYW